MTSTTKETAINFLGRFATCGPEAKKSGKLLAAVKINRSRPLSCPGLCAAAPMSLASINGSASRSPCTICFRLTPSLFSPSQYSRSEKRNS
ncbi:MAG: hypothetical protein ACE5MK_08740, partial [Acidobacteriota bacterium]